MDCSPFDEAMASQPFLAPQPQTPAALSKKRWSWMATTMSSSSSSTTIASSSSSSCSSSSVASSSMSSSWISRIVRTTTGRSQRATGDSHCTVTTAPRAPHSESPTDEMFLSRVPNHDHDHNHILSTGKSHTSSRNTDSHAGGRSNDGQDSNTPDKVSITNGTRRVSSRTSVSHPHHHHRRGTNGRREWNGGGGGSGYHHPPSSSPLCNTLSAATAVTSHPPVEQIEFHLKNRYGIHSNHQRGVNGLDDEELGMVESIADTIECWEGSEVEMETIDLEIALLTERQTGIRDLHGSMRQLHDIQKDLATIVMEQDETLEQFQTHALETLDHSTGALAQLLALQQRVQYNSLYQERRRTTFLLMAALVLVAVMGTRWIWKTFYPATEDGVPEH